MLVTGPAAIEEVLVGQSRLFPKENIEQLRHTTDYMLFGTGLLTSNGDFWLRQRRLAQPAFHRQRIADYSQAMLAHTEQMLTTWRPGQSLDVHEAMMELTLNAAAPRGCPRHLARAVGRAGTTETQRAQRPEQHRFGAASSAPLR